MKSTMTSLERVLTTLGHKEPDRVPLFLLTTMHGAKELGLSIKEYFSKAENVVEGQLRLRKKYRTDCYYPFFYAPIEVEAWGAEVIYHDDGPPNSGYPMIENITDINTLTLPDIENSKVLAKVLQTITALKEKKGDEAPIIGVAMSPFSLPVMQLGFDTYFEIMYNYPDLFNKLMMLNKEFCTRWSNAQLKAGATAICYFDPVSSSTITTRKQYETMGYPIAQETIASIDGPVATHYASGRILPISDLVSLTGTAVVGVSAEEDLTDLKKQFKGKQTLLGNLNGIAMRSWSQRDIENVVKDAIAKAGPGGGFILSDNHGEIPFQVSDDILLAISETVYQWGEYPLSWIDEYGE